MRARNDSKRNAQMVAESSSTTFQKKTLNSVAQEKGEEKAWNWLLIFRHSAFDVV